MKEVLNNIFAKNLVRTSYCTVLQRLSATRYELEDFSGRIIYAESEEFYPAGVTVIVLDNRIVGRGSLTGKHRRYEV